MDFTTFLKNLKTYEMKMKARKDCEPQKESGIGLKASPRDYKEKSVTTSTTSEDQAELTLLVQNINMHLKNGRRSDPKRKGNKKTLKTISWDSDSESEVDSANRYFMSKGMTP